MHNDDCCLPQRARRDDIWSAFDWPSLLVWGWPALLNFVDFSLFGLGSGDSKLRCAFFSRIRIC